MKTKTLNQGTINGILYQTFTGIIMIKVLVTSLLSVKVTCIINKILLLLQIYTKLMHVYVYK